jgi:hypothetical protein
VAFVLPEAAVEVPEAAAAAPALLAWLGRFGQLAGMATSLLGVLFGNRPSEPATGNAMRPIVDLLAYPQRAMYLALFYINTALDAASHALVQTNNRLGAAYNQALRITSGWVNAETRARVAQVRFLDKRIGDAYNQALRVTSGWVNAETRARVAQVRFLDKRIGDAYNQALRVTSGWVINGDQATKRAVDTEVTRGVGQHWPQLVTELGAATTAAGTELIGLRGLIEQVPARAPATLEAAAADPLAVTRVLTRALTECTIPNCRNLSKYGRDLHGLGEALGLAGLVGFLAYCVSHPHEAAVDTENTAVALLDGVTHEVSQLLGV